MKAMRFSKVYPNSVAGAGILRGAFYYPAREGRIAAVRFDFSPRPAPGGVNVCLSSIANRQVIWRFLASRKAEPTIRRCLPARPTDMDESSRKPLPLVLGINAAYHETAAAIVRGSEVIFAAEEERYTREKHAKPARVTNPDQLPWFAIRDCLRAAAAGSSRKSTPWPTRLRRESVSPRSDATHTRFAIR